MHIKGRNVNELFKTLVQGIHDGTVPTRRCSSRNGDVLQVDEPVIITYTNPRERVLFNAARDCSPAMHLYEAMWMLAGRNDVAPLVYYAKQFAEYSDDGKVLNGAYGYRWRHHKHHIIADSPTDDVTNIMTDQLKHIIEHLKAKPESRRAVLQMYDVENDLLKADSSRDICCNLSVLFSQRKVCEQLPDYHDQSPGVFSNVLDMTVFNRSNDLIWGALGANCVHFSMLQEFMAAKLDCGVGVYSQVSNNMHVYEWNWKPEEWLGLKGSHYTELVTCDQYAARGLKPYDMMQGDLKEWDRVCAEFVDWHWGKDGMINWFPKCGVPFFDEVAGPLCMAFHAHKRRNYADALDCVQMCKAEDWQEACMQWLLRRKQNWEQKNQKFKEAYGA